MKKMMCRMMLMFCLAMPLAAFAQSGDNMSQEHEA